ncbi:MAG: Asp-tRNA(Asn)/Glu-tRNA(Gln) amidotransferase subunit GatB [Myxococcota bacterium]
MSDFEPVIGLEVHCQLRTRTKLFCGCATGFGAEANTQVCPVCLGLPGVLPVTNGRAIELALRMAIATGGRVRAHSRFARKNYFYPDLPKGYQISQFDEPLVDGGVVEFEHDGALRKIGLVRIHVEDDAGKSFHLEGHPTSLVDFNRAGMPLIEVVSQPELRSPEEAAEYLRAMRTLVRFLDVCDGNMDEGSLRCDANVSVRPRGAPLGTRVEIKNMNSFRHVERALRFEIDRQIAAIGRGEKILQQTRLWDTERGVTEPMRSKEEAHDYRYFPDPDLPPIVVTDAMLDAVRRAMPELPRARRERFVAGGLSPYDAGVLCAERELADYFEGVVRHGADAKKAANFIMTEVLSRLADAREAAAAPVAPAALAELLALQEAGTISGKIAKDVFSKMWDSGKGARAIVEAEGLVQVRDAAAIEEVCRRVIDAGPKEADSYRAGKTKVFGFFVGQVMKETHGKADPALVNEILKKLLTL